MAIPPVRIEVQGLDKARQFFAEVVRIGQDPTPLLEIFGSTAEASTRRRFDEEHGPGGIPWPKSQRALGKVKGRRGTKQAGKTLTDLGELESSLRYNVTPGRVEIGFDGLTQSSAHAAVHQFGVDRGVGVRAHSRIITQAFGIPLPEPKQVRVKSYAYYQKIPARPMLGIDGEDRREIKIEWVRTLRSLLRGRS